MSRIETTHHANSIIDEAIVFVNSIIDYITTGEPNEEYNLPLITYDLDSAHGPRDYIDAMAIYCLSTLRIGHQSGRIQDFIEKIPPLIIKGEPYDHLMVEFLGTRQTMVNTAMMIRTAKAKIDVLGHTVINPAVIKDFLNDETIPWLPFSLKYHVDLFMLKMFPDDEITYEESTYRQEIYEEFVAAGKLDQYASVPALRTYVMTIIQGKEYE